jgi:hypothetical protein
VLIALLQRRGALVIRASTAVDADKRDADIMNVTSNYIEEHGYAPSLFIFDFARSDLSSPTDIPWSAIEKIKDGNITNTKYKGVTHVINRPWIMVSANAPCPAVSAVGQAAAPQPLAVTGDRIIEVNVRELNNHLQEGLLNAEDIPTMGAARDLAKACKLSGTRIFDDYGICSNNDGIVEEL